MNLYPLRAKCIRVHSHIRGQETLVLGISNSFSSNDPVRVVCITITLLDDEYPNPCTNVQPHEMCSSNNRHGSPSNVDLEAVNKRERMKIELLFMPIRIE